MITIVTIDDTNFSINGIVYPMKFISTVSGTFIAISNMYDSRQVISNSVFSDYVINGASYNTAALTQAALSEVLFKNQQSIQSFKNKVINSNFSFNTSGYVSGTATTTNNQYTLDRWRIRTSGGSITFVNNTSDSGKTVTIPSNVYLEQVIEAKDLVTGQYTVSWAGTALCTFNGVAVQNGGTISYTYGSGSTIAFYNGTLSNVQFEKGNTQTPYEVTPSAIINSFVGNSISFKNKIINGSFIINQRGYVSGTATTTNNQYTLDRWRIRTSGGSITFVNNTSDSGKTVTIPSNVYLEQVIEAISIQTGTYTISWDGTSSATVNNVSVSNGGSISLTYGSNVTVAFTNGTLSNVQFEYGLVKTNFEHINYYVQLELCKRFYEKIPGLRWVGQSITTQANQNVISGVNILCAPKRAAPTVIVESYIVNIGGYDTSTFTFNIDHVTGLGVILTSGPRLAEGVKFNIQIGVVNISAEL